MILLGLVVVIGGVLYAVRREWPGTEVLRRFWRRRGPAITRWVVHAPFTYRYLLVLAVTTWLLQGTSADIRRAFLEQQGTDLAQLSHRPVEVLIRSALYVSPSELLEWVVLFTLVMAPLEHRVRWRRVLGIFAVGHVGASLLVGVLLVVGIRHGWLPQSAARSIDVGASYGFAAIAGAATYIWPRRRRIWWALGCLAVVGIGMASTPSSTDVGHLVGLLLGFAMVRVVTRAPENANGGKTL